MLTKKVLALAGVLLAGTALHYAQTAPVANGGASAALQRMATTLVDNGRGDLSVFGTVNGTMPVQFILDSGAAMVSLPQDIADQMLRDGSLTPADYAGNVITTIADGSEHPQPTYALRSVTVGNQTATNVTCMIGPPGTNPLLGQTFLKKFDTVTIDNKHRTLVLA
jgi:predicted aspartyl protease